MAHEFTSGVIAERPSWHGLEDFSAELLTSAEAAQRAGLDGTVEKVPVFGHRADGTTIADPGRNLIVYSDGSIVGRDRTDDFHLVQPAELFAIGERIFGEGEARVASALRLRNGGVATVNYKLDDAAITDARGADLDLDLGEQLDWYLSLSVSWDGSFGFGGAVTGTRVECMNTLVAALGNAQRVWKVKLTSGAGAQIALAESAMANVLGYSRAFYRIATQLRGAEVTPGTFDAFAEHVYATRDGRSAMSTADKTAGIKQLALKQSWRDSSTIGEVRNTGWGAFNAFTEFAEWLQPGQRQSTLTDAERFMDRYVLGGDAAKEQTAALEYLTGSLLGATPAELVATK